MTKTQALKTRTKAISTTTFSVGSRTPLYAVVGAGELAVEKTRALPGEALSKATTIVPRTTALVVELPKKAQAETSSRVAATRTKVEGLRTQLISRSGELQGKATTAYGELVRRGEGLVSSIRKQESTKTAVVQAKAATTKAKAAARNATRAAKATAVAVEDAAETVVTQ